MICLDEHTKRPYTLAFGARMRHLRLELGMSLAQLERKTGISKGHLSTIEQGFTAITIESVMRIAAGLDLSPLLLLAFPDDDKLAAIVDLIRQVPTTHLKKLRKILERWIDESDAS
jgi:transcriptional regulator with XRE-family HTH domain